MENTETRVDVKRPIYLENLIEASLKQDISVRKTNTELELDFTIAKAEMQKKIVEVTLQIANKETELTRKENNIPLYPDDCYEVACEIALLNNKLKYFEKLLDSKFNINA